MTCLDIEVITQPKCVCGLKPTLKVEVYVSLDFWYLTIISKELMVFYLLLSLKENS